MSSSMFRGFSDTGPARGAHGAAAPAQVAYGSDIDPFQSVRQHEWAALGRQLDGIYEDHVASMKALRAIFAQRAGTAGSFDTSTGAGQANALLKKAKSAILKAEVASEDDDEQPEDAEAAIERATKLLASAKRILAACVEDDDESETEVEKAMSVYKKTAARLASLKSKATPAPAVAATTGTGVTQKAVAELDKATGVLQAQLSEVVDMLGHVSRNAGSPPNFAPNLAKAANTDEPSIHQKIAHMRDIGTIDTNTAIQAKSIANRLALAKSGQGSLEEVREHVARSGSGVIKNELFKDI
jgi:hypothetical protein